MPQQAMVSKYNGAEVTRTYSDIPSLCMTTPRLCLPFIREDRNEPWIVFTHGLGNVNPQEKSHLVDTWTWAMGNVTENSNLSFLTYTARGHGESWGWQDTAESDPEQFTWERMAGDMAAMANANRIDKFIAGGSSMGSASALFLAIQQPERILALILIRLPTAWQERDHRREALMRGVNRVHREKPNGKYHLVLKGAIRADLPKQEDTFIYAKIKCPVLILAIEGDDGHPVSTAKAVHKLIPHSQFHSAPEKRAVHEWRPIIKRFLVDVIKGEAFYT